MGDSPSVFSESGTPSGVLLLELRTVCYEPTVGHYQMDLRAVHARLIKAEIAPYVVSHLFVPDYYIDDREGIPVPTGKWHPCFGSRDDECYRRLRRITESILAFNEGRGFLEVNQLFQMVEFKKGNDLGLIEDSENAGDLSARVQNIERTHVGSPKVGQVKSRGFG